MVDLPAMQKVQKARAGLVLSQPFFASLALRLTLQEDSTCETAWTNGTVLGFNPEFVAGLTLDQTKGLLCHEVMHCACSHHTRRGGRDKQNWNVATDLVINGLIDAAGIPLPSDKLLDRSLDGLSAEQVYGTLPTPEESGQDSGGNDDPGGCGEVRDAAGESGQAATPSEMSQQSQEWQLAVSQAAQLAKSQGTLPGSLARLVQDIISPRVDWRSLLRRFIEQTAKTDYSWNPPNRRYIHAGIYLPSLHSEQVRPMTIAVDTSGSVDEPQLAQFAAEITAIVEETKTECRVIYCDSGIRGEEAFTPDDLPITLHAVGGGGTDFRPAFDLVDKSGELPSCLIYLTDLECHRFPDREPDYPVLWASWGSVDRAPWGEVVKLDC